MCMMAHPQEQFCTADYGESEFIRCGIERVIARSNNAVLYRLQNYYYSSCNIVISLYAFLQNGGFDIFPSPVTEIPYFSPTPLFAFSLIGTL